MRTENKKVKIFYLYFKVGLVPTMGSLHQGHMNLIEESKKLCDTTIVSIFVNPAQFAPHEDFFKYPWNPERDIEALLDAKVDHIFIPSYTEMYPFCPPHTVFHDVSSTLICPIGIDTMSEGKLRPGFFTGVCTVVGKLFNIIDPNIAVFGQKDGLQLMSVRRMVRDLNYPVEIVSCPTARDIDGLAQSSRNVYLSESQRKIAPQLYRSLCRVQDIFANGEGRYDILKREGLATLSSDIFTVEYFSICDSFTGSELIEKDVPVGSMVSAAINFGNCRLIDNILLA